MATTSEAGPRLVFIVGTGRCGSSLISEVLARHSDVGFMSNVQDRLAAVPLKGRWNNAIYRRVPQAWTRKGRLRFAPSEGYRAIGRQVSPMLVSPVRDLVAEDAEPVVAERFRSFFGRMAEAQGKPVFLHKFTGWPRVGFIDAALPDVRFIHVVRDGRAVANSLLQMPWWGGREGRSERTWGPLPEPYEELWRASGRGAPVLAALEWRMLTDAFEDARVLVSPDRWYQVRYEDFLAHPQDEIGNLLRFICLGSGDDFERDVRQYRLRTNRTDAFVRDLGPDAITSIESVLAGSLIRYGYPAISAEREDSSSTA